MKYLPAIALLALAPQVQAQIVIGGPGNVEVDMSALQNLRPAKPPAPQPDPQRQQAPVAAPPPGPVPRAAFIVLETPDAPTLPAPLSAVQPHDFTAPVLHPFLDAGAPAALDLPRALAAADVPTFAAPSLSLPVAQLDAPQAGALRLPHPLDAAAPPTLSWARLDQVAPSLSAPDADSLSLPAPLAAADAPGFSAPGLAVRVAAPALDRPEAATLQHVTQLDAVATPILVADRLRQHLAAPSLVQPGAIVLAPLPTLEHAEQPALLLATRVAAPSLERPDGEALREVATLAVAALDVMPLLQLPVGLDVPASAALATLPAIESSDEVGRITVVERKIVGTTLRMAVEQEAPPAPAPVQQRPAAPAGGGDYPFAYRPQADRYRIVISTPRSDAAQVRVDGRDVFVQLDRPLKNFNAESAVVKSDGWVENAQAGYDSVLFRAARPIETTVERKPSEIVITFAEAAAPPAEIAGAADRSELRLKTLEAQLTTREGAYEAARAKYQALRKDLPGDAEPTAGLAEVAERQGRWKEARDLYSEASRQAPANEEVREARDRIAAEHKSFVRFEAEMRKSDAGSVNAAGTTNDLRYLGTRSTAELQISDRWRVGFNFDAARVKAAEVGVFAQDVRTVALDGWARRADAFVRYDDLAGGVGRLELYADSSVRSGQIPSLSAGVFDDFHGRVVGAGAEWSERLPFGRLVGRVEWRRPNWDFTEGLAQGGTRDRALLSIEDATIEGITGRAAIGVANYGLHGSSDALSKPNLARSIVANLDFRVPLDMLGTEWGLGYSYDAEYVLKKRLATFYRRGTAQVPVDTIDPATGEVTTSFITVPTATPEEYAPVPLVNREVHVLTGVYTHEFLDRSRFDRSLLLEVALGPGIDRYGRGGWVANTSLSYACGPWRFGLRGGWVAKIGRNGDSVGTFGVSLMRQF